MARHLRWRGGIKMLLLLLLLLLCFTTVSRTTLIGGRRRPIGQRRRPIQTNRVAAFDCAGDSLIRPLLLVDPISIASFFFVFFFFLFFIFWLKQKRKAIFNSAFCIVFLLFRSLFFLNYVLIDGFLCRSSRVSLRAKLRENWEAQDKMIMEEEEEEEGGADGVSEEEVKLI